MNETCPECGEELDYDEVDIGVGVQRDNYFCSFCYWAPGAKKVPCECGCGKMSFNPAVEHNHPEDYRFSERGCS
jgi:hypothetical protein